MAADTNHRFAIVMSVAVLLAGLGFAVLTVRALIPADKREGRRPQAGSAAVASA